VQHYGVNTGIDTDARESQTGLTQHAPKRISLHVEHVLTFLSLRNLSLGYGMQDLQLGQHLPERLAQRPTTVSAPISITQVPNHFQR